MEREVKLKTDEERKAALEAAFARIRPVVKANTEKDTSVMGRLAKLAKAEPEKEQEKTADKGKKKDKKSLSLDELAKKQAVLDKKAKENGVEPISKKNKKDEKEKENDKDKKKDNEKKNEDPIAKKQQEMKVKYEKVALDSGCKIRQEGPAWVMYSKDEKQKTDITSVMEAINKFNRGVDEANEQNKLNDKAQGTTVKPTNAPKKDGNTTDIDRETKIQIVAEALPNVKDVEGKQVFKPEDCKKIAEIAIDYSNDLRELEAMKREAAKLERKMEDERKKNERDSDDNKKARDAQMYQNMIQNQR